MKRSGFIPGLWEEEIHVTDFIQLNRKDYRNDNFLCNKHELMLEAEYDVLADPDRNFIYLSPCKEEVQNNNSDFSYLSEFEYERFVETGDRRKLIQMGLLETSTSKNKKSFLHPDICAISLYGTRHLIREIKQYIKDLEVQLQNQEWIQRRIAHNRSLEALYAFERFADSIGVSVKRPSESSKEAANVIWVTMMYAVFESVDIPYSLYSVFSFLDIYLERDISKKILTEEQAQRIVDELYCKMAYLSNRYTKDVFNLSYSINSSQINKTIYRLLESALCYSMKNLPFQLVFNTDSFPENIIERMDKLFKKGHPMAFSQSLRKRNATDLTVTPFHTFFRNYEDITFEFASLDLERALMVSINGGRDALTNTSLNTTGRALGKNEIEYENVMSQFEVFLKYFITYYVQYCNVLAYYYDQFHNLPFRQSLISNYPHYLINMPYHNVKQAINILSAIYEEQFELKVDEKGYISKIIPKTNSKKEFIGAIINDIIHAETARMLFYKNGNHNIVFFSESPHFQKEDKFDLNSISPISFLKTSFSGFHSIKEEDFKILVSEFKGTSYTHIRLSKK